jgi:hypothetical protein
MTKTVRTLAPRRFRRRQLTSQELDAYDLRDTISGNLDAIESLSKAAMSFQCSNQDHFIQLTRMISNLATENVTNVERLNELHSLIEKKRQLKKTGTRKAAKAT